MQSKVHPTYKTVDITDLVGHSGAPRREADGVQGQRDIRRKRQVLEYAVRIRNIRKTCRHFGIPRSLFYVWRAAFEHDGEAGLVNKRSVARSHPRPTRPEVAEQVLHLRRIYHLVPKRIVWYLARYQGVKRHRR